jgi:hypothetical protein
MLRGILSVFFGIINLILSNLEMDNLNMTRKQNK